MITRRDVEDLLGDVMKRGDSLDRDEISALVRKRFAATASVDGDRSEFYDDANVETEAERRRRRRARQAEEDAAKIDFAKVDIPALAALLIEGKRAQINKVDGIRAVASHEIRKGSSDFSEEQVTKLWTRHARLNREAYGFSKGLSDGHSRPWLRKNRR